MHSQLQECAIVISLVLRNSREKKAEECLCVEQSRELFSKIRGRGKATVMLTSKCAFILVQSQLSIPRVVTNMSLA